MTAWYTCVACGALNGWCPHAHGREGGLVSRALGHLPAAAAAGGRALVARRGAGYFRDLGRRGGLAKAAARERAEIARLLGLDEGSGS